MPYIFPKRRLQNSDILDPVELNEDFIPATDLYSGHLDEHNFESGINPSIATDVAPVTAGSGAATPILSNAHWNIYYAQRSSNPGWTVEAKVGPGIPFLGYVNPYNTDNLAPITDQNAFGIQNVNAWQPIDDLKLILQTSNSKLWIVSCFQFIWEGFNAEGGHKYSYPPEVVWANGTSTESQGPWAKYPCMIQFALRVDGQIIEDTKTGLDLAHEKVVRPYQTMQERGTAQEIVDGEDCAVSPGPGSDGEPNCGGLSPEVGMVRLGNEISVSAGIHTIDVVVRRLPVYPIEFTETTEDVVNYSTGNRISVYNRQIFVVESPIFASPTAANAVLSTPALEAEDVVSASSLGSQRVDLIRDRYNDVEDGALARGALNNRHLSSKISHAIQSTLTPVSPQQFQTYYPGFGSDAFTVSRTDASPAFYGPLNDGLIPPTGNLEITSLPNAIETETVILLLANVEVRRLNKWKITDTSPEFKHSGNEFCVFCIASDTVGTFRAQDGLSEAACNRDTNMGATGLTPTGSDEGQLDPIARDIPLMRVIKVGGAATDSNGIAYPTENHVATGTNFTTFTVHGATMAPQEMVTVDPPVEDCPQTSSGAYVVAQYARANLSTIFFRKE